MTSTPTVLDTVDRPVDADLLERPVVGFGFSESATLQSVLTETHGNNGISLLVFLRHFG